MRVLSVATSDQGGGAERIAWDLFSGLEERGHDSWLAVGKKHGSHPRVFEIHASPWFDYRPFAGSSLKAVELARRWRRFRGLEDFVHPYSRLLPHLLPRAPEVVVAHNLHGGYFDLRALPSISRSVPLVAVLHDYWLLTGHCAYPFDCDRWRRGCGRCPHLDTPPAVSRDATRTNLRIKRSIYRRSRLSICSPSRRLLDDVEHSVLGDAARTLHCIPNGVDLELFQPGDSAAARMRLGLPQDIPIILMVGLDFEKNPFKDYGTALACAGRLAARGRAAMFVVLGGNEDAGSIGAIRLQPVSFTPERSVVADYFRAADVLLHSTRQEVAPLVLSEALASGLPAVATAAGNSSELLGDGGVAIPCGDADAHAAAVERFLDDPQLRRQTGERGRQRAVASGDRNRMIAAYEELLLNLVDRKAATDERR